MVSHTIDNFLYIGLISLGVLLLISCIYLAIYSHYATQFEVAKRNKLEFVRELMDITKETFSKSKYQDYYSFMESVKEHYNSLTKYNYSDANEFYGAVEKFVNVFMRFCEKVEEQNLVNVKDLKMKVTQFYRLQNIDKFKHKRFNHMNWYRPDMECY